VPCGSGGAVEFCAALPAFTPPEPPPARLADQSRPCDDPAGAPSFCLAVPSAADPVALRARRQDACAQLAPGDAPAFCLAAPPSEGSDVALQREVALVLLRQRLGPGFQHERSGAVDLWIERGAPSAVADALYGALSGDAAAVAAYFGRPFRDPPAVFLFLSRQSFAAALERQFGFPAATAAVLSRQYGGIVIAGIDAVAVNGEAVLSGGRPALFRHELAHVAIHQRSGEAVPPWLDEGLATLAAGSDFDGERAVALSLLARDPAALRILTDDRPWIDHNAALDGHGYAVAAEAARLVRGQAGDSGVATLLDRMGAGIAPQRAIEDALGEPFARFVAQLPERALAGCRQGLGVSAARGDGLVLWSAWGFAPQATLAVRVDGPQDYAFSVTTDRYGTYTGTLGSPMPAGSYELRVRASDGAHAALGVTVGSTTAPSARGC
jgi:hypothetical protein